MTVALTPDETTVIKLFDTSYQQYLKRVVRRPKNFRVSPSILIEAVDRFFSTKDLIEHCHADGMNGSDPFKVAGYLVYWLAKLKPITILEPKPNVDELVINEFVALNAALIYFDEKYNVALLDEKIVNDLLYALRYRTLTARILPSVFEAYVTGFKAGIEAEQRAVQDALTARAPSKRRSTRK